MTLIAAASHLAANYSRTRSGFPVWWSQQNHCFVCALRSCPLISQTRSVVRVNPGRVQHSSHFDYKKSRWLLATAPVLHTPAVAPTGLPYGHILLQVNKTYSLDCLHEARAVIKCSLFGHLASCWFSISHRFPKIVYLWFLYIKYYKAVVFMTDISYKFYK